MKRIVYLFASILIFKCTAAQNADSIENGLKVYKKSDTVRLNMLFSFCQVTNNSEKEAIAADEAIIISINLKNDIKLAKAYS